MNLTVLILASLFLLTTCTNSIKDKPEAGDRLLADPEHAIKDSPGITKFDRTLLYTGWYYLVESDNGYKRQLDKSTETYFIDRHPIVTAKNFTSLDIYESNAGGQTYAGLSMNLDDEGTANWSVATEKSMDKKLAFILDNRLLEVARVNSQITTGVTALNRREYSRAELENFKTIIESEK
jgi:preprotein translocase subunit SecD